MYWIYHDKEPLKQDYNFNCFIGSLIKELYDKDFMNFCFGYNYEYDQSNLKEI